MSTSPATPKVTHCPPMPAHIIAAPEPIFADHKQLAVSGRFDGHDMQSTGLSFGDYSRMSCVTRKQSGGRKLPVPEWATDDRLCRDVLVRFLERRAGFRNGPQPGDHQRRLQRAHEVLLRGKPKLEETLHKLCREYSTLKCECGDPARLRTLEIQIQNIDSRLVMLERAPALTTAVAFLYFRLQLDCVGVSMELGGQPSPVCVRKTIWRLNDTWKRMADEPTAEEAKRRWYRAYNRTRYVRLKAAGLCLKCGGERAPGKSLCVKHLAYAENYRQKARSQ